MSTEELARQYAEEHEDDVDCGCARCDVESMKQALVAAFEAGYQACYEEMT